MDLKLPRKFSHGVERLFILYDSPGEDDEVGAVLHAVHDLNSGVGVVPANNNSARSEGGAGRRNKRVRAKNAMGVLDGGVGQLSARKNVSQNEARRTGHRQQDGRDAVWVHADHISTASEGGDRRLLTVVAGNEELLPHAIAHASKHTNTSVPVHLMVEHGDPEGLEVLREELRYVDKPRENGGGEGNNKSSLRS